MKVTCGTWLLAVGSVLCAADASAQTADAARPSAAATSELLERPAGLQVTDVPFAAALGALQKTSGVPLVFSPTMLAGRGTVSCDCEHLTVANALRSMLTNTSFRFQASGDLVIIRPLESVPELNGMTASVVRAPVTVEVPRAFAVTITGRVTSRTGAPIAEAVVRLYGTRHAARTRDNGAYRLVIPDEIGERDDSLQVMRVGYHPVTVPVRLGPGPVVVDIVMTEAPVRLDELVVSGTVGNQTRKAQAAVVATIDASDVMRTAPVSSVQQLLMSRVPGLSVSQQNGTTTGGTSQIRSRGISSLSLSPDPLIFIDGVRIPNRFFFLGSGAGHSTLSDLNPNDIESVEVVKGPAAATLYGADASSGVIQIITKRGKAGSAMRFTQNVTLSLEHSEPDFTPPSNFARCTAAEVVPTSVNPLCRDQAVGTIIEDNPIMREGLLSNGHGFAANWSGSGGAQNFGYHVSVTRDDQKGVLPKDELERTSIRTGFNFVPHEKLTVDLTLGLSRTFNAIPFMGSNSNGLMSGTQGNPLTLGTRTNGWFQANRTGIAFRSIGNDFTIERATPSLTVNFRQQSWLTHHVTVGVDASRLNYREFYPRNSEGWYGGTRNLGQIRHDRHAFTTYTVDYLGNARWNLGRSWVTDVSAGMQLISANYDSVSATGNGLISNSANTISSAATVTARQAIYDQRSVGYLGQLQLAWNDRMFLQVGARVDQNSSFGGDAPSFFLPKVGGSYVISEEPWWPTRAINTFRVRAAFGTTGRSPPPGAALNTYASSPYLNNSDLVETGVIPLNPGNANLKPERGQEFEAGFDLGVWRDRIGAEATFFSKRSKDLLLQAPIPQSLGYSSTPFVNIGSVLNSGFEVAVRGLVINHRKVSLESRVSLSTLHNNLTSLGGTTSFGVGFFAMNQYREGMPLGSFFAQRVKSIDVANNRAIVSDTLEFLGDALPKHRWTVSSDLTLFGDLRLSGLLEIQGAHKLFNQTEWVRDKTTPRSRRAVAPEELSDEERLRLFGPYVTESGATVNSQAVIEEYVQDAGFARLREVSATWMMPERVAGFLRADNLAVTVGARNLGLWTRYRGYDPENAGFAPDTGLFFASDFHTLPQPRRYFVRFNASF